MKRILGHRPSPGTAFGLAALLIALGGVAFAAIPDSGGTIHGCYQKNTGNLRVAESSGDCRANEMAIEWNRHGPPGTPGSSTVQKLPTLFLDGERSVLFTAGPLTFTAQCGFNVIAPGISGAPVSIGEVLVSTTQDHAAISGEGTNNPDLLDDQPRCRPQESTGPRPSLQTEYDRFIEVTPSLRPHPTGHRQPASYSQVSMR